jgi:hypothetical protein
MPPRQPPPLRHKTESRRLSAAHGAVDQRDGYRRRTPPPPLRCGVEVSRAKGGADSRALAAIVELAHSVPSCFHHNSRGRQATSGWRRRMATNVFPLRLPVLSDRCTLSFGKLRCPTEIRSNAHASIVELMVMSSSWLWLVKAT